MATRSLTACLAVVLLIPVSSLFAVVLDYEIIDLGVLSDQIASPFSVAHDINNVGQVVGMSLDSNGKRRAFLWENGSMSNLGTLGGDSSEARAINKFGQIVGVSENGGGTSRAFLYNHSGSQTMIDLGNTLGGTESRAEGINDAGKIVGSAKNGSGNNRAFIATYSGTTTMTDIGTLNGGNAAVAFDINNSNEVVGLSQISVNGGIDTHAFFYDGGTPQDLGILAPDDEDSAALAINDISNVVGDSGPLPSLGFDAFFYDNAMEALDGPDAIRSSAQDINIHNQVVGSSPFETGEGGIPSGTAVMWEFDGLEWDRTELYDLLDAAEQDVWLGLSAALGINDQGWIVGHGRVKIPIEDGPPDLPPDFFDEETHAFLLRPIPEPASLCLLALGGLVIRSRRSG